MTTKKTLVETIKNALKVNDKLSLNIALAQLIALLGEEEAEIELITLLNSKDK